MLYTPELADTILGLYVEGMSLQNICQLEGMPTYGTVLRWLKDSTKFVDGLEGARRARAIHFEEKALGIADVKGPIDKDFVAGERLKFDVYKWGAEVGDPTRFGKKVTVGGDPNQPIVFKVITGVPEPTGDQASVTLNADGTVKKALPDIVLESEAAPDPSG